MELYDLHSVDWSWVVALLLFGGWCFLYFCQLLAIFYGRCKLHRPIVRDAELVYPGVSIAKPLIDIADPNLKANLETYFHLQYSEFEILFCIQSESQVELVKMVKGLMAKYPNIDSRLFVGARSVGVNPKVNNMINAYDNAKYPMFLISDAGVRVTPDTLTDMVRHMTEERVGAVHQLPAMLDGSLSASRLIEKVYFGTSQARMYLSAGALGVNCMTSMSCLLRRRAVDELGGLRAFGCYIGEDFFLGQALVNRGYKLVISTQPVQQNPGLSSVGAWNQRMIRWMHLRFSALPQLIVLEPLSETVFYVPLATWSFLVLFDVPPYVFLPVHLVTWFALDLILLRVVEGGRLPFSLWSFFKAWLCRELSVVYIYARAVSVRTLTWGGRSFRLRWGGKADEVNSDLTKTKKSPGGSGVPSMAAASAAAAAAASSLLSL